MLAFTVPDSIGNEETDDDDGIKVFGRAEGGILEQGAGGVPVISITGSLTVKLEEEVLLREMHEECKIETLRYDLYKKPGRRRSCIRIDWARVRELK